MVLVFGIGSRFSPTYPDREQHILAGLKPAVQSMVKQRQKKTFLSPVSILYLAPGGKHAAKSHAPHVETWSLPGGCPPARPV
jgi:hypothetical protein